jgi:hypothetical protein
LVCETTSDTGSHMRHRVCLTPEQIEQRHRDSQRAAQDLQNRGEALSGDSRPPV